MNKVRFRVLTYTNEEMAIFWEVAPCNPVDIDRSLGATYFVLNPLKRKLVQIIFKDSVRTSKRTPYFTITKIDWLTLFKFNKSVKIY
jgi:hypothetical protein